jgi:TolB protein
VFTLDAAGTNVQQVTPTGDCQAGWAPTWSPDGQRLVFTGPVGHHCSLFVCRHDGTDPQPLTDHNPTDDDLAAWSPDGKTIAFTRGNRIGPDAIVLLDLASGQETRLTSHGWLDSVPAWSPDSRWIVFHRAFAQPAGLYVVPAEGGEAHFVVPGHWPDWSPTSRQIAFIHRDSVWVLPVSPEGLAAGDPWPLTRASGYRDSNPSWAPDGRRLVFEREMSNDDSSPYRLLVMDAESGECWNLAEGQDPDWSPVLP